MLKPARYALIAAVSVAVAACGDGDPAGSDSDLAAFIDVESEVVLTEPGETYQLSVTIRNAEGDPLPGATPEFSFSEDGVASVSSQGLVQALSDGEVTLTVRAGMVAKAVLVTVDLPDVPLEDGVRVTGLDGPEAGQRYYVFEVPPDSENHVLLVRLVGGSGDADLVLRRGDRPVPGSVDCFSASGPNTLDNLEFCAVPAPAAGDWHVLVYGFEAYDDVALEAAMVPLTTLESGVPQTDLSGETNDLLFFRLQVPSGADLTVTASAASGNVELFAGALGVISITDVGGLPCVAVGGETEETCTVVNATGGSWLVTMLAGSAFTGETLTAQIAP